MKVAIAQSMKPIWAANREPDSDIVLVERLQRSDMRAFEALFRRHYGHVHAVLTRLVGDEADDYCQQVFLRLYQNPPRETTHLEAWLKRVATNLGLNALRGRTRWQRWRDELARRTYGLGWLTDAEDPAESLGRNQEQQQVRQVLSTLPRRQATLLALRYSGHSYAEIAEVLDIAPGSVGTLLARAEKAFADRYRMAIED